MKSTAGRFARLVVLAHFLILAVQLHAKPLKIFMLAGHYLGCAKTFALMGKAFAEANLQLMKAQAAR